jgi:hypothetical protein
MFRVFPVLFPVAGEWFHNVPCVPCFRCSRYEHNFLYSFLAGREHWEQWEVDCTGTTSGFRRGGSRRGTDREQGSGEWQSFL